jgi:glycosyltransferase involved in cell wall biosynthesis
LRREAPELAAEPTKAKNKRFRDGIVRVLHVIQTLDPAVGGPPYVAICLAAAQTQLGNEVHLAYYRDSDPAEFSAAYSRIPNVHQVRHHSMTPPGRWERLTALGAGKEMRSILPTFDVVHLHEMWHPLLWRSANTARKLGVPYAITPHGMLDPWCLQQKSWKKRLALALGWRHVLDRAAFVHVLNADEGRLLERLRLTGRVESIPNGVDVDELGSVAAEDFFQTACGFPGDRTVLFLGRLHHKKGLDYLGAAFEILHRRLPDVHLVVAGPDAGAQRPFLRQIARSGLDARVHLVGPLYGDRKRAALCSAACFCLPSRQEGFSIAILEAMACRIPVIVSDPCHFPEVAECGAGYVVALDPDKIATALQDVLENRAARQRMGDAGFQLVLSRYTWPKIAEQCIRAYERNMPKGKQ